MAHKGRWVPRSFPPEDICPGVCARGMAFGVSEARCPHCPRWFSTRLGFLQSRGEGQLRTVAPGKPKVESRVYSPLILPLSASVFSPINGNKNYTLARSLSGPQKVEKKPRRCGHETYPRCYAGSSSEPCTTVTGAWTLLPLHLVPHLCVEGRSCPATTWVLTPSSTCLLRARHPARHFTFTSHCNPIRSASFVPRY